MKILLLTDRLDVGGAETHLFSLATELCRAGHSVTVISSGGHTAKKLSSLKIRHIRLPLHQRSPLALLISYFSLQKIIKKSNFDVIHSHARLPSLLVSSIAKKQSVPLVCTAHAKFSAKSWRRFLSEWGNSTIAVSEDLKQYLIDVYDLSPDSITVIPNGIDTSVFSRFVPESKNITVAFLSRLDDDCSLGAYLLCKIAPRLAQRYGNARILIGGGGNQLSSLRQLAKRTNSALGFECVSLVGNVKDTREFLRSATVFVGVSRAAMEAGLCSLPVVLCGNEGFVGRLTEKNFELAASNNFCGRDCGKATADKLFSALCEAISAPRSDAESISLRLSQGFDARTSANKVLSVYKQASLPSKKTEVLLCGYYGFGNMGDDVLLRSAIARAKKEFSTDSIGALTLRPKRDSARFGISCKSRRFPISLFSCKHLIFGGGTLLQEDTSLRSLCYYSLLLFSAKALGAKVYLWGNGLGAPRTPLGRALLRLCLDKCDYIGLRDKNSLNLANSMTANPNVFLEDDLALSSPLSDHSRLRYLLFKLFKSYEAPPPFIIIAPRKKGKWRELIRELCEAKEKGYKLLFTPLHRKSDTPVARAVCEQMGGIFLDGICYSDLISLASCSKGVYSMRLHALIAARTAGVPFYSFSCDQKIRGYFKE